jgi:hypothetical protein
MTFPSANRTPTSIGTLRIRLIDEDGISANMRAYYSVDVLDENGEKIDFPGTDGDLVPHLTPTQISNLVAFMQAMRDKAVAEFLA